MKPHDAFTNPRLSLGTLDIHLIRNALLARLKQAAPLFSGTLLDVGCGQMPYRDLILSYGRVERYIGLDLEHSDIYGNDHELTWDGVTIPLTDNSVDCAMATEVLEHCPDPEKVLGEICRKVKPGGVLFVTVPFLWPLHDVPYDQYRFTPFSLARHLQHAGFEEIQLHPLGGWDESLAQMIGLFVRRRPMPGSIRFLASLITLPLVYFMTRLQRGRSSLRGETATHQLFSGNPMFTGISGVARKSKANSDIRDH